jgi:hypothetical protein
MLLLVACAPTLGRGSGDAGALIAVASEVRRDFGYPLITAVRVAFAKSDGGWAGFPDPSYSHSTSEGPRTETPLPKAGRWAVCFDGRRVGNVSTILAPDLGAIALSNVHQPAPGERIPFHGKPSRDFVGGLADRVHRPVVLTDPASCGDPDKWKPSPVPPSVVAAVMPAFREAVKGVHGCDAEGKSTGPYNFPGSEVAAEKSYASARGERIITLTLRARLEITGGCNDGPLDDQWLPHTFAILANGTIRHLGSSMALIDAGDYDHDGHSELVFAFAKDDYDGYTLFWDGFERSVTYGWIYH